MKKIIWFLAVVLISFGFHSGVIHAEDNTGAAFNVSLVGNENQYDTTASYFDLRLAPLQRTDLVIKINNLANVPATFDVAFSNVTTNSNMIYTYNGSDKGKSVVPTKWQFQKLAKIPNAPIAVAANSSEVVTIPLMMPADPLIGKLFGGITVTRHIRDDERQKNGITNQFSYTNPVVISESDEVVQPNIVFGNPSVTEKNGLINLAVPIEHTTPTILSKITTKTIIKNADGKTVLNKTVTDHHIAPQSAFDFEIPLDNNLFKTGKYQIEFILKDEKGHLWRLDKSFKVTQSVVKEAEKSPIEKNRTVTINPWYIIFGLVLFIILLLILFVILWRRKRK
ncbi:MAG TPA: DUF916 domain-containing protein [Lactobacillaceae bacterium]|jgi:LPXTG-motif cell wall-anchored protein